MNLTNCSFCGHYYYFIDKGKKDIVSKRLSFGCLVCSFDDNKDYYYRQLLLDFRNMVHKDGKWVISYDNERFNERIKRTIRWMYNSLGPIVAEQVFYDAFDTYWYTKIFNLGRNRQS